MTSDNLPSSASKKLFDNRQALVDKIQKEYGYSFVNFDTIVYPGKTGHYTTIEVIRANQPTRMRFIPPSQQKFNDKPKNDVIMQMEQFINKTMIQFTKTRKSPAPNGCPVFHCIHGFDNAEFKPYLKLFNRAAVKQRKLILETLKNDPNPERRSAAVFLIGHFKNPQDILAVLLPYVTDKDNSVRNNTMRVIGETMRKAKISKIDVRPFIELLDSPFNTDRNKALFVLLGATKSQESSNIIKQIGLDKLLAMLALTQPNNHNMAYQILKTVSGQDWGEKNERAWANWVKTTKT